MAARDESSDDPTTLADAALFSELKAAVLSHDHGRRPTSLVDPASLQGYEVLEEIHRGSQGIVYRALQAGTGREVAIKVLLAGPDASEEERSRFQREVSLAAGLDHPNIVTIYESGVAGGHLFYAMQYIDGERLDDWIDEHGPSLRERLELFAGICGVVGYAHGRHVVHRDLKPGNILVDRGGCPHVCDFGLAKAAPDPAVLGEALTASGEFVGTLAFASPEQVRGRGAVIDARSDVYALGVVLYELLTGAFPYDVQGGMSGLVDGILRNEPRDPSAIVPGLDDALSAVVLKALAKEPVRRYRDAADLGRDVRRWLAGEPVVARRASAWQRAVVLARRHTIASVVLAAAAVLVLVVGVLLGMQRSQQAELVGQHRRQEAELSARYRAVFDNILAVTTPAPMGGGVTMLDVVAEATRTLDESMPTEVDARAAAHQRVGEILVGFLQFGWASSQLNRAWGFFEEAEAGDHPATAACAERLARTLARSGHPSAEDVAQQALAMHERLGTRGEELARAHVSLGRAVLVGGDPMRLDDVREHARAGAVDGVAGAPGRVVLAELAAREGDEDGAEALLRRALHELSDVPGIDRLEAHVLLADLLLRTERRAEADGQLDLAVALSHELHGAELLPEMLWSLGGLAHLHDRRAVAERLCARSLALSLRHWAPRAAAESARLSELAARMESRSDDPLALPFVESFAALRSVMGDGAYEITDMANDVSLIARDAGRHRLAADLLEESLLIRCRTLGRDCPHRVESLVQLGRLRREEGDVVRALAALEDAWGAVERSDRHVSRLGADVVVELAAARAAAGETRAARDLLSVVLTRFDGVAEEGGLSELQRLARERVHASLQTLSPPSDDGSTARVAGEPDGAGSP